MTADTIAAISTAPGKAGVAIVRVSGLAAFEIAAKLSGKAAQPGKIVHSQLHSPVDGRLLDDAVVLTFRGPRSYTGEDVVEFQCHGGSVTPRCILEATFALGARLARRGEFTERAFLNGRLGYDEAEAVIDLIDAKTERAADAALHGLGGAKQRQWRALYDEALTLSSELEHALDVDEGDLPAHFLSDKLMSANMLKSHIDAAIDRERRSAIMREGALVVLAGAPNAGKSSLMNALLQENRAIVSAMPGTTRDSIEAWLDLNGFPVRLVDTAGIRESEDAIEVEGVRRARELIEQADIVLGLDCNLGIRLHAKCDLGRGEGVNVSAKTGEGLDELKSLIAARLESLEPRETPRGVDLLLEAKRQLNHLIADPVILANSVRSSSEALGQLIGAIYNDDLLDRLFSRFCIGK